MNYIFSKKNDIKLFYITIINIFCDVFYSSFEFIQDQRYEFFTHAISTEI